nr:MAG TPA: hypothetical protein [Caudoviricetes sp.]
MVTVCERLRLNFSGYGCQWFTKWWLVSVQNDL